MMIKANKKLSVIIVSYNNIELLDQCLDSVIKFNDIGDELEIIVSDNSPDYNVVDHIEKKYPSVITIKNENKGFGAGNNRGVEISSGKYLLFLNPDTILIEPIFQFAVYQFDKYSDLGVFGFQLLDLEHHNNPSFYIMDRYGIISTIFEKLCRKFGKYIDGMMYIAGADMFVRREAFISAGRFDENIFMYDEEPDLIKRIKSNTEFKTTKFYSQKKLIHLEGGTNSSAFHKEYTLRSRIIDADVYYAQKWNINIMKILRGKRRYIVLKALFYRIVDSEKFLQQKKIIDLFDEKIKMLG